MTLSDVYEKKILDAVFGKATVSPPANYFVCLLESAPVDGDTALDLVSKESSYTSYARVQTASSDWSNATGTNPTESNNVNPITFPQSTGGSSVITHFAVVSVASGAGDMLFYGTLDASRTISPSDTPEFQATALAARLD